jgi:hypothetical protein
MKIIFYLTIKAAVTVANCKLQWTYDKIEGIDFIEKISTASQLLLQE